VLAEGPDGDAPVVATPEAEPPPPLAVPLELSKLPLVPLSAPPDPCGSPEQAEMKRGPAKSSDHEGTDVMFPQKRDGSQTALAIVDSAAGRVGALSPRAQARGATKR
jgi:hypothetical protein